MKPGHIFSIEVSTFIQTDRMWKFCNTVLVSKLQIAFQLSNRLNDIGLTDNQAFCLIPETLQTSHCKIALAIQAVSKYQQYSRAVKSHGKCHCPYLPHLLQPMINQGLWRDVTWPDGWTSATIDGKRSAQFEHTIVVTEKGCEVLTARLPESPPLWWEKEEVATKLNGLHVDHPSAS